jgi:hypothetical protein
MEVHVWALEGRQAIYIEKMQIFKVLISKIEETEDHNGFMGTASIIKTHGLRGGKATWTFGANWSYFHATSNTVASTYAGWRIYTNPSMEDELARILTPLPEGKTYMAEDAVRAEVFNWLSGLSIPIPLQRYPTV